MDLFEYSFCLIMMHHNMILFVGHPELSWLFERQPVVRETACMIEIIRICSFSLSALMGDDKICIIGGNLC
jgi:hypothetical protein